MFVGAEPDQRLRWTPGDPDKIGFLELSRELEREFVESELQNQIEDAPRRVTKRWQMQKEARRLLANVQVLRIVKTGPNKGKVVEHSFAVCNCCRFLINQGRDESDYLVGVLRSKKSGRAFFKNIKRCGSVWTCPICAARITERKRKELQEGLENWKGQGGLVFLVTLTVPHHGGESTEVWLERLLLAYRKMRNRTTWRRWGEAIGLEGSIRALEVTYAKTGFGNNGAHVHIHLLLFCLPTDSTILPRQCDLLPLWQSACVAVGLEEPTCRGVDICDGSYAARYATKWGLDYEITKTHCKRGKRDRWTPWDLLVASEEGDTCASRLFVEYAQAFFGQRQLEWTPGLRIKLRLAAEKSDETLAEEPTDQAELIAEIPPQDWQLVLENEAHAEVLNAATKMGAEGVKSVLHALRFSTANTRRHHWRN